ncbi:MAG: hypothetical protein AABX82_04545, partial [Nanoarchaeota archaeon]
FEKEKPTIQWENAEIQEKIDGSLICVFHNGKTWEVTTRGTFYPLEKADIDFSALFKQHFNVFNKLEKGACYMFEIITTKNRIVTWYNHQGVYLIGARLLHNFCEFSQNKLDHLAADLGVYRPKRYQAFNIDDCKRLFQNFKDDEEGLVVVDSLFNRIKLKQESYIKLSKIKMLNEQEIFEYILGKTAIDVEYIAMLPEVQEVLEKIKTEWETIVVKIEAAFAALQDKPTRKEFAFEAIKYPFKKILFALYDKKDYTKLSLHWDEVKSWNGY